MDGRVTGTTDDLLLQGSTIGLDHTVADRNQGQPLIGTGLSRPSKCRGKDYRSYDLARNFIRKTKSTSVVFCHIFWIILEGTLDQILVSFDRYFGSDNSIHKV